MLDMRVQAKSQSRIGRLRTRRPDPGRLPPPFDRLAVGTTTAGEPRYRHLARLIEERIATGECAAGTRLPPERDLALALGLSRTTTVSAYRELASRGLVRAHVGRGTFVAATPEPGSAPFAWRGKVAANALRVTDPTIRDLVRASNEPGLVSLAAGMPALDVFPHEAMRSAIDAALRVNSSVLWRLGPTEGLPRLREALASRYRLSRDMVLVTSGAQQGIDLVARCLIDPGDAVVVDRPGYLGAIQAFRAAGARLVSWNFTGERLDELEDLLLRYRPKLLFTNPTFQNPTGHTLSIPARRELLALARRYRLPVVEDDTYRELALPGTTPPPSLAELDGHEVVIGVGTFSKMLAPGVRLGWVSAAPAIVEQLALVKQRADPHTQNLAQDVIARLIEEKVLDRHLTTLRTEHATRLRLVAAHVSRELPLHLARWSRPTGGLYLWGRLASGLDARQLLRLSIERGVTFVAGPAFYADQGGASELRVCFTSVPPDEAARGIRELGACLRALPARSGESVPVV